MQSFRLLGYTLGDSRYKLSPSSDISCRQLTLYGTLYADLLRTGGAAIILSLRTSWQLTRCYFIRSQATLTSRRHWQHGFKKTSRACSEGLPLQTTRFISC